MRAFVQDYFSTVTSDPETTFAMLTPEFQAASGGYERLRRFWSTISSATPYDIRVDPRTLTASYTIDYVTTSGRTSTSKDSCSSSDRATATSSPAKADPGGAGRTPGGAGGARTHDPRIMSPLL